MANDYVDMLLDAGISGIQEIGNMSSEEIGAMVKAAARKRMPGGAPPSPMFGQSSRDTLRRAPLGFTVFTLAAAIGATNTQSSKVSRKFHADRLLIVPSGAGIVIDSIKVGDEEQLLSIGVPVELYGTLALTDSLPDNFSPVPSGIDVSITLRNTTAGALTALVGLKGGVER